MLLAQLAGESEWIARAFPLTVDGLVLAAVGRGRPLLAGARVGVSVAANVLVQFPEHAAEMVPIVLAWPLALYGTHRLLRRAQPS